MVTINIDPSQLKRLTKVLSHIKDGAPKVLSQSINRALNKGRTEIRREIRKEYVIKQKDIPIRVVGSTPIRLGGAIIIKDTMLDLGKFKIRPLGVQRRKNKRPIHAQVRTRGGGNIPHAFMTTLPYPGPFVRRGQERLPIKKLVTIGAPIMASQPKVGAAANKAIGDTLAKEVDRNIKRMLDKPRR